MGGGREIRNNNAKKKERKTIMWVGNIIRAHTHIHTIFKVILKVYYTTKTKNGVGSVVQW